MAWWTATPNNGPPPFPGFPGSSPGFSGPIPPPGNPFWDPVHPEQRGTGYGVDHAGTPLDPNPEHGFALGPGGFNAWSGRNGFGGGWGRGGRGGWGGGGWGGGWGGHHGRRGHGRHGRQSRNPNNDENASGTDEDLYDVTAAAATAEAEIEEVNAMDAEKADSPATARDATADEKYPDPPEEAPSADPQNQHPHPGCHGRRGFRGRGGRGGHHRGRSHNGPPPFGMPFEALANHPFAQRVREYVEQHAEQIRQAQEQIQALARGFNNSSNEGGTAEGEREDSFNPPVDIFNTQNNWTIHIAVPGAKKEDIGVHWDADRSVLTVAGVVHRPGDEEFLAGMLSGERKVGLFERKIKLPPAADANELKDEVDGDNITAKMEDGILIVVVPKVEKEWTEIKKVDIL